MQSVILRMPASFCIAFSLCHDFEVTAGVSITRRMFLQQSTALAASWALGHGTQASRQAARPVLDLSKLTPFVDPLPIPPVARAVSLIGPRSK